ncbi:MAG: hypothetical protein KA365_06770 [Arenimonas sp.]|nr:hypothetical protein [Arenimonas sp.]MBP6310130.1 hypothetical protein [Arenimonas sp.]
MKYRLLVACIAVALSGVALAADSGDQQRIAALEARIKVLEENAAQLQIQAAKASEAADQARLAIEELKTSQPANAVLVESVATSSEADVSGDVATTQALSSANAFNPAISIILNGSYQYHSLNPEDYYRAGFANLEGTGPETQGFSLGESEITLSSNIDDKFYGQITVAFSDEEVGIEEAYIETTSLPNSVTLRAGRFFSNIGYLNSRHAHTDYFFDRPNAYQSLLANQYGDDGIQIKWVAPTDLYIELGAELFAGSNFPAQGRAQNGFGAQTLFAHFGGDVGSNNSWLAGLSFLNADSIDAEDGFTGNSKLYIADATWKWAPQGNFKDGGFLLQTEYIFNDRNGEYADANIPDFSEPWNGNTSGAYIQGVYRFNKQWEAGYRFDQLWADENGPYASDYNPYRNSVMFAWHNSEFSVFRLQYSLDQPNQTDTDNAIYLQYITSLGAHGAHKF